jgi:hypothetical protein
MSKKLILFSTLLIVLVLLFLNLNSIRTLATMYLTTNQKEKVKEFIFGKGTADILKKYKKLGKLNYNEEVLPKTQFTKIDLKEISLKDLNLTEEVDWHKALAFKFQMEQYKDNLIIADGKGKIYFINKKFILDSNNLEWNEIKSNLNSTDILVKDLLVIKNELYVSYLKTGSDGCNTMSIAKAKITKGDLFFETFFNPKECGEFNAGRMAVYNHNGKDGLLFSTDTDKGNHEFAQNDDSVYGKILFIDFVTSDHLIFSRGHRTPQGLIVEDNSILSVEHGPRGGDEINLIEFGNNYGWPIASYGEPYYREKKSNKVYHFLKNHSDNGFVEPIYSFVPSIGINQIIKIPEKFSYFWKNNFFVTSLEGRKIYRILFDKDYKKLIFHEKIYIGKRIRDIMYIDEYNVFLLALEGSKHSKVDDKFPFIGVMKEILPE